ncbi:MAG: M20/M25/M40 family metallo-hydrolase [Clostridiales bacterium]|jgi:carboxypeptidase PM20D1|nr:M20/M25/M40 family metallo-hydrolase [Clostridiales bacterium]
MLFWLIPVAVVGGFFAILSVRAALFIPKKGQRVEGGNAAPVEFDAERAVTSLQRMVQLPTVSNYDKSKVDPAPFEAFRALLKELYPLVHKYATLERIGDGGVLYCLKGKTDDAPTVFMAHYDVVPAHEEQWQNPPFCGKRKDGELWGRGTLDTKGTLCAALEAAETLLQDGFVPARDIFFSFAADEEVAGDDAPSIVDALRARNIRPALVLDEGGAVVDGVFPGVTERCALIGTGEKGMMNVELLFESAGGHASAPPPHSPVGVLAQAVNRVEGRPFPAHLTKPAAEMFDTLGRHSTFVYRLIFANLWCFKGLLSSICKKSGGELNALMRTTCAFTAMRGSGAYNVLPPVASVGANLRLCPPDNIDSAKAYLKSVINNDAIKLRVFGASNPSPCADTKSEGYARVKTAIEQTWQDAIVSPYMMVACSDSRHFCKISDTVLRFSAMVLSGDDRKRIHGNDERIEEAKLKEAVAFYMRVISAS